MLPEIFGDSVVAALAFGFAVVAASTAIAFLANFLLRQVLRLLTNRSESPLRSVEIRIIGALRVPLALLTALYGIRLALVSISRASSPSLGFVSNLGQLGHNLWLIAIAALACYTASRLIIAFMRWYSAHTPHETRTALNTVIFPILIRITSVVVFTLGALIVLDVLGIPITPLLAGIGIGGLAVALALTPTITSFIAGTYVVAEGHISEGDYVEIDSERAGFVVNIGWRSTVLRSRFNNVIVVPNNLITDSILTNYTTPTPAVTGVVECGVSYDSDLREVERVCLEVAGDVIEESDDANKEFEPIVRFSEFSDSNINFRLIFQGADRVATFAIKHEMMMRLHKRFKDEGIEINYPVRKLTSALPGDLLPPAETEGMNANVANVTEDTPTSNAIATEELRDS